MILSPLPLLEYRPIVPDHLRILPWNVLTDGGNEFLGREDLEDPLVAPSDYGGAIEDRAGVLRAFGLAKTRRSFHLNGIGDKKTQDSKRIS